MGSERRRLVVPLSPCQTQDKSWTMTIGMVVLMLWMIFGKCLLGKQQSLQFCPLNNTGDLEHILRIRLFFITHHRIMTTNMAIEYRRCLDAIIPIGKCPNLAFTSALDIKLRIKVAMGLWHAWTTAASCEIPTGPNSYARRNTKTL